MKNVIRFLKPYIGFIVAAFFLILLRVWGELTLPDLMSNIVDHGIVNADMPYIWKTGGWMIVVTLISTAAILLNDYLGARTGAGFARDIRKNVFYKVMTFSGAEMDRFGSASLITRTVNDITQLQNFYTMFMRIILMAPMMVVGAVFMAFQKNAGMSLIFISMIPLMVFILAIIAKLTIPLSVSIQKKVDRINLIIREKLTGIRVIRAFTKDEYEMERFDGANTDLTQTMIKLQRIASIMMPSMLLILNAAIITIVWVGAARIEAGALQVGDMMAVIQYVMHIMISVTMLTMVFIMYPRAAASAERIGEILKTEPSISDGAGETHQLGEKGVVEFKNVGFRYGSADELALEGISFTARPGQTTAIIGSTGSGKSTLVNLIPRLYDVSEGEILVDGVNVKDYTQEELRNKIGFVPQKAVLFSGTIRSNIMYGNEEADDSEVRKAADIAQSTDFITEKADGFDSHIAQGGTNVSGGQKQRLSIARAVVKKPEIYVFDDSFSALDYKTDAALRAALAEYEKDSAVIVVAQRVSTIIHAEQILVLDEGRLVGKGTHKELYENCDVYREIVLSQLSEEEIA